MRTPESIELKKLAEIRDLQVLFVSLVDAGANNRQLVWKSKDADGQDVITTVILKVDEEQRRVYCIVYTPKEADLHDDYMTAEEIQKANDNFMKRSNTNAIDEQHNMKVAEGVWIVENWIVKDGDKMFGEDVGAWAMGLLIENDEVWEKVKSGEYTGLSLYGFGEKIEKKKRTMGEDIKDAFQKLYKYFNNEESEMTEEQKKFRALRKDFNESYESLTWEKIMQAMSCAMYEAVYNWRSDDAEKAEELLTSLDQMRETILSVMTANSSEDLSEEKITKAGKTISQANLDKLQSAYDSIKVVIDAAVSSEEKKQKLLNKKSGTNSGGETEMTEAQIKKMIEDAVEPVQKKNSELEEELKKEKEKVEKLENATKGKTQANDGAETKKEKVVKFNWGKGLTGADLED